MSLFSLAEQPRILIVHHWPYASQRQPLFSTNTIYITSNQDPFPNVINVPLGAPIDMSKILSVLPPGWEPDLFIAKVDAFFNLIPRNVDAIKCPKVLVLGDTQHGENPLLNMITYAHSEPYDLYITDHKRHHLWYYWLSGLDNLFWIPGLFHNAGNNGLSPFTDPRLNDELFNHKTVFIGQTGKWHPRRQWLMERFQANRIEMGSGQLMHQDSLRAYRLADISLNISLNGDLNLRVFEVIASQGFLLTDALAEESGQHLLFEPGKEIEEYHTDEECIEKIQYFQKHPDRVRDYKAAGYKRYLNEYHPKKLQTLLTQLINGQPIDSRFTTRAIRRVNALPRTGYTPQRIALYQLIQYLHKIMPNADIAADGQTPHLYPEDFFDLPRISVSVYNAIEPHRTRLQPYLTETRQASRVTFQSQLPLPLHPHNIIILPQADNKWLDQVVDGAYVICPQLIRHPSFARLELDPSGHYFIYQKTT